MTVPEHTVHYLEIVTPDVEAATRLYSEIQGWEFEPAAKASPCTQASTSPSSAGIDSRSSAATQHGLPSSASACR